MSKKIQYRKVIRDLTARNKELEYALERLAIRALMRYPHFERGDGLKALNKARQIIGGKDEQTEIQV
ncbi:MAG: hypothetical protein HOG49_07350 [Candidatus Scalindua sp.]|jgi:hypothetical protein|nr:hypothetical protein [Candidatus Scalindua sp.]